MATKVEKSVVVNVPVETAYDQWTQFEEFPHFMGGISEVRQLNDTTLHWVAEIGGIKRQWQAQILEQVPNEKVAWAATEGATNAGAVYFAPAGAGQTTVRLELEYEPEGVLEKVADKVGIVGRRAEADLEKFKSFIEDAGYASGAWRGTLPGAAGTPGVEDAAASRGDSGNAGVAKKVIAGAAAAAKAKSGRSDSNPAQETDTFVVEETVLPETQVPVTDPVAPPPTTPPGDPDRPV